MVDLFNMSPAEQAAFDAGCAKAAAAPPMSPELAAQVGDMLADSLGQILKSKSMNSGSK